MKHRLALTQGVVWMMPKEHNNKVKFEKASQCKNGTVSRVCFSTPMGDLEMKFCPSGIHTLHRLSKDDSDFSPDIWTKVSVKQAEGSSEVHSHVLSCLDWLKAFFGQPSSRSLAEKPSLCFGNRASGFYPLVWETLAREVPFGTTISYGKLAILCGSPGGSRAVGTAMRENPILLMVPCHRVIKSDGQIGHFSGGKSVKQWLLSHEQNK
ncbi:unnamed protein product [Darwinula stevensoni]|uniref:Methylated-DNA--protein-cysteine methyltransferase n=1 Tax=Darwinula stevensoni TaxID=69355 RepID=A0A7R9A6T1_9CRUS|nr:unnamed protein product [Darwinula stevensoni]CAG0890241.1 unnamed protein product [Darwinula stevensoni]